MMREKTMSHFIEVEQRSISHVLSIQKAGASKASRKQIPTLLLPTNTHKIREAVLHIVLAPEFTHNT